MSIREYIDRNRSVTAIFAVIALVAILAMFFRSHSSGIPGPLDVSYYTTDDGHTYFSDDVSKVFPFDKNGKPAYRAYVYKCAGGQPFVGYLAKVSDSGLSQIAALHAMPSDQTNSAIAAIVRASIQVKKPGETKWVSSDGFAGSVVMTPTCPDGGTNPEGIYP